MEGYEIPEQDTETRYQNRIPQQARKRDGRLEPKNPQEFEIRYPGTSSIRSFDKHLQEQRE
jgi:hypothetical protein